MTKLDKKEMRCIAMAQYSTGYMLGLVEATNPELAKKVEQANKMLTEAWVQRMEIQK